MYDVMCIYIYMIYIYMGYIYNMNNIDNNRYINIIYML